MRDAVLVTTARDIAVASHWTRLRSAVLGISPKEVSFERRGFAAAPAAVRAHLERAGTAFVDGYNSALWCASNEALTAQLDGMPADLTGFAYEGASMALALLDLLLPKRASRWQTLVESADRHVYLCLVGAGWALPRLHRRSLPRFVTDRFLWPLVYDGYGFHEGFFHARRWIAGRQRARLDGYAARAFDQGFGRSLWFVDGANPDRIAATIAMFPESRREDLWSGIGLAAGYAGGVERGVLASLRACSGPHAPFLAQGAVFAAAARLRASNVVAATALATETICNLAPHEAAAIAEEERERAWNSDPTGAAYETWRRRIAAHFEV